MGVEFDSDELIDFESSKCIHCGSSNSARYCVRCKARESDSSDKATAILILTNNDNEVVSEQEVWVH